MKTQFPLFWNFHCRQNEQFNNIFYYFSTWVNSQRFILIFNQISLQSFYVLNSEFFLASSPFQSWWLSFLDTNFHLFQSLVPLSSLSSTSTNAINLKFEYIHFLQSSPLCLLHDVNLRLNRFTQKKRNLSHRSVPFIFSSVLAKALSIQILCIDLKMTLAKFYFFLIYAFGFSLFRLFCCNKIFLNIFSFSLHLFFRHE